MRVFSWQEGSEAGPKEAYWLDSAIGIVVNRPANPPQLENWSVSFRVNQGPSAPTPRGVLRLSSRYSEPQLVEFNGTGAVRIEVPLAAGRNDIRVEVVEPKPKEVPGDLFICMVQVTGIKIQRVKAAGVGK